MKIIKKLIVLFLMFCLTGCDNVSKDSEINETGYETMPTQSSDISIVEGDELGNVDMPEVTKCYYEMDTLEELKEWIVNPETKKMNDGAFKNIIEMYQKCGYVIYPVLENKEADKISMTSDLNTIRFSYKNPSVNICIEALDNKLNEKKIEDFMMEKYDAKFNVAEESVDLNTGNVYTCHYYTLEEIVMKDETIKCVIDTRETPNGDIGKVISLLKDGMYIDITYFDNRENRFYETDMEELIFEKMILE